MSDPVHDQYEAYPYPARDPAEEKSRLITGSPSNLAEVNHYVFAGRRDFSKPFHALVAGGGTGDAAIMLAQQLADSGGPGDVVYLDLSSASRAIAEARAAQRGLGNISFHSGSLLELNRHEFGKFDYIDCCGVLHHLDDPNAGLRVLNNALADDGGIGLMLYGTYGRDGVYPAQDMLRQLCGDLPLDQRVGLARRFLDALPPTNALKRNLFLGDHKRSDAELVDLLLHPRDRAYTVPEIFTLLETAGLRLVTFIEPARYTPATYINDPLLLKNLAGLSGPAAAAFAETLADNMKAHVFYAVKDSQTANTVALPESAKAVPILRDIDPAALSKALRRDLTLKVEIEGLPLRFAMPRLAPVIIARIDGKTSLDDIHQALRARDSSLDWAKFKTQFDQTYAVLNGINRLLLSYLVSPK